MGNNPFLEDEEDETGTDPTDNVNFKQLRDYAKKLEREGRAHEKELEALRAFKAEAEARERAAQVNSVFKKVGLSEKHSALFAKINPEGEVTEEAVLGFATEYELPRSGGGETPIEGTPEPAVKEPIVEGITEIAPGTATQTAGFAPTQSAGAPQGKVVTDLAEAEALSISNPAEYARLREAGRIQIQRLPGSDYRPVAS